MQVTKSHQRTFSYIICLSITFEIKLTQPLHSDLAIILLYSEIKEIKLGVQDIMR